MCLKAYRFPPLNRGTQFRLHHPPPSFHNFKPKPVCICRFTTMRVEQAKSILNKTSTASTAPLHCTPPCSHLSVLRPSNYWSNRRVPSCGVAEMPCSNTFATSTRKHPMRRRSKLCDFSPNSSNLLATSHKSLRPREQAAFLRFEQTFSRTNCVKCKHQDTQDTPRLPALDLRTPCSKPSSIIEMSFSI